jgi:hypothetical protein
VYLVRLSIKRAVHGPRMVRRNSCSAAALALETAVAVASPAPNVHSRLRPWLAGSAHYSL